MKKNTKTYRAMRLEPHRNHLSPTSCVERCACGGASWLRSGHSHSPWVVILDRGGHKTGWLKGRPLWGGGGGATTAVPFFSSLLFSSF